MSSYFLGFLKPRRMVQNALTVMIQQAYIQEISTGSVDELVQIDVPRLKNAIVIDFLVSEVVIVRVRS